jgi:regulator of nucleoside diphosphate kinase
MTEREILITGYDMDRLRDLIEVIREYRGNVKAQITELERELDRGKIVDSKNIPPDVITMNSAVQLRDLDSEEDLVFKLVFPSDANVKENKISILAPIGTALLGYRVGDIIEWEVPAGRRKLEIKKVIYQPEASKHFHL